MNKNDKSKIDDFLSRMEKHMELREIKLVKIDEMLRKDHTFKPHTYSKGDKASKYYER